ncbi:imidazole glycerol phosphate synthase subunit HisH [Candidatus Pelagibacter sp.]|nr:imidazole glycerol phosphate synthase subunit HisH [Candidatus Pelagibacter sp.]MDC1049429.1 imidazole glycerol phosphate synthase subunit HisH [Candidatus Pelagibacter sp.]
MIGILDLGVCNLKSIYNAVYALGFDVEIIDKKNFNRIDNKSHIVLPGVGSYSNLSKVFFENDKLSNKIESHLKKGNFLLGICLGMQFLSTKGFENFESKGLNLIEGSVIKIKKKEASIKIPHIGWNEIEIVQNNKILKNLDDKSNFYFVHSYIFQLKDEKFIIANTNYGDNFPSIINKENIFGFQFHPEKSSKKGLLLLDNFCRFN